MSKRRSLAGAGTRITAAEAKAVKAALPKKDSLAEGFFERVGKLGDQPELRILSSLVIGAGLVSRNARLTRAGVRMILAHELATAAKDLIKRRIDRTRPRSAGSHRDRKVKLGESSAKEETSFPSGHSAGATAVARAFSREFGEQAVPAYAAAALVAAAQVPRCAHYPTDVAAGIALGAVSEVAADFLLQALAPAFAQVVTLEGRPQPPLPA